MNIQTDLLIVGAGPTGLTAAIEAIRHGLSVRIIDKNEGRSIHSKALVAHARSLEIFHDMGLIDSVLASGKIFKALNIYDQDQRMARILFEDLDWKDALYPFWLSIPQSDTERCLEEKLNELGIFVERQTELIHINQSAKSVMATLKKANNIEEVIAASWLIGCDGARIVTRKLMGLNFVGHADDDVFILADVRLDTSLPEDEGYNILSSDGVMLVVPLPEPHYRRLIFYMPDLTPEDTPDITKEYLQELVDTRSDLGIHVTEMGWTSSFSVKHFVASNHRKDRVFLAGDAAHIHSPVGGQGMNSGIQDAYNLIWKLALFHQGKAKPIVLDSYETERHQVAESLIKRVSTATQIVTINHPLGRAIRNKIGNILINTDTVQNQLSRNVAMLDIHYQNSNIVKEHLSHELPVQTLARAIVNPDYDFHKAPKAGYRAPNVVFNSETQSNLYQYLYGIHHTALIFLGHKDPASTKTVLSFANHVQQQYQASIHPVVVTNSQITDDTTVDIIIDHDDLLHQAYGGNEACVYIIRPDLYIGYRNQQLDLDALTKYLDSILL